MAHSDKQQPDSGQHRDLHNEHKSQALSRDIEDLNNGLRVDFDNKLSELADLLARFKALVVAPSKSAASDATKLPSSAAPDQADADSKIEPAIIPPIARNTNESAASGADKKPQQIESLPEDSTNIDESAATSSLRIRCGAAEPARFESGLYKLNCQLYRFRLELDQELEFREEPLHIHFNKESELSQVLQKLGDKSSEINPDS